MADTSLVFNLITKERVSEGLGKAKQKFDAAAAGIAAGVGVALGSGISGALDVSAANSKLAAQLGLGAQDAARVAGISADIYANNWGDSTEQVNEAIKNVYQNIPGATGPMLQDISTQTTAFAQIFDQDVGGTTRAVGNMLRTGLAGSAEEAFDILAKGMQNGTNKADDLLDTFNEYPVQFQALGLSGQDAMGLLSQAVKAGARDSDIAADALKEFGIRGKDMSATSIQAYKDLGLNADMMTQKIAAGGPQAREGLGMVVEALRGVDDPAQKAAISTALFGTQSEDLQLALGAFDLSKVGAELGNVSGVMDAAMTTMGDNPAAKLEEAKRKIQAKLTEIGGSFVNFAMGHQDLFRPIAVGLAALVGTIVAVKAGMVLWTTATTLWSAATTVASGVSRVWSALQTEGAIRTRLVAAAQWLWNAAMSANPIGLVVIAIAALAAGIYLLWTRSETFRNIVTGAFNAVKDAALWMWDGMKMVWDKVIGFFTGIPAFFSGVFSAAGEWLKDAGGKILDGLLFGLKLYWTILYTWYVGIPLWILGVFVGAVSWLLDAGKNILTGLGNGITGFWNGSVVPFFTAIPGWIKGAFNGAVSWLVGLGGDILSGLWNGIQTIWNNNVHFWSDLPGKIKGALSGAASWLVGIGEDIIRGVMTGVGNMAQALLNKAKSVITAPVKAAAGWLGINSPSKVWAKKIGMPMGEGVAYGLDSTGGLVVKSAERLLSVAGTAAMSVTPDLSGVFAAPTARPMAAPIGGGPSVIFNLTVSSPLADRQGLERLGQQLLPAIQRELRGYKRGNSTVGI